MAILATYINTSSFSIEGEHDAEFEIGRGIRLNQGVAGYADVSVLSAIYSAGTDLTTINVVPASCVSTLVSITRGAISAGSAGAHYHTGHGDGGPIPASSINATETARLKTIADLVGTEGEVLQTTDANAVSFGQVNRYVVGTAGETLAQYDVTYLDYDGYDSVWLLARTGGTDEQSDGWGMVASAVGIEEDATGNILQFGEIENALWDWIPGRILWLDTVAGGMTDERPTDNPKIQLGHALTATRIFWNPIGAVSTWNWRGAWVDSTYYANDDVVSNDGHIYIATVSHTASASADEPGTGTYWGDVWELVI